MPPDVYALLRLSTEFIGVDKLAEKSLSKGEVGEFAGMAVIKVPTGRWPKNVNFVIAHKSAVIVAEKLNDTKLHTDPPGISGNLLEGRMYYDCFVFEQKAGAVYAEVNTASGGGSIVEAPTHHGSHRSSGQQHLRRHHLLHHRRQRSQILRKSEIRHFRFRRCGHGGKSIRRKSGYVPVCGSHGDSDRLRQSQKGRIFLGASLCFLGGEKV